MCSVRFSLSFLNDVHKMWHIQNVKETLREAIRVGCRYWPVGQPTVSSSYITILLSFDCQVPCYSVSLQLNVYIGE